MDIASDWVAAIRYVSGQQNGVELIMALRHIDTFYKNRNIAGNYVTYRYYYYHDYVIYNGLASLPQLRFSKRWEKSVFQAKTGEDVKHYFTIRDICL